MTTLFNRVGPRELITSNIIFLLTLAIIFVGDFVKLHIFLFFPIYLFIISFRYVGDFKLQSAETISALVMAITFVTIMLANASSVSWYYFSLMFSVLFIFVIPMIEWLLKRSEITYFCAAILLMMLPPAVLSITEGDIRSSIIFGPNVYYRIIGYLNIMFVLISFRTGKLRNYRFLVLLISVVILLSTGSRGAGFVVLLLLVLHVKVTYIDFRTGVFRVVLLFVSLGGGFLYFQEKLFERFWRFFYFSLENSSLQVRASFFSDFLDYLKILDIGDLLFGDGESERVFSFYPHNIFLESFVYHGIFVSFIFVAYLFIFLYALYKPLNAGNRNLNLVLLFSPIFLGSISSGNFFEAYTVAAVSIFVMARRVVNMAYRRRS